MRLQRQFCFGGQNELSKMLPRVLPTSCAHCSFAVCSSRTSGTDELLWGYNQSDLKNQVILLTGVFQPRFPMAV